MSRIIVSHTTKPIPRIPHQPLRSNLRPPVETFSVGPEPTEKELILKEMTPAIITPGQASEGTVPVPLNQVPDIGQPTVSQVTEKSQMESRRHQVSGRHMIFGMITHLLMAAVLVALGVYVGRKWK